VSLPENKKYHGETDEYCDIMRSNNKITFIFEMILAELNIASWKIKC